MRHDRNEYFNHYKYNNLGNLRASLYLNRVVFCRNPSIGNFLNSMYKADSSTNGNYRNEIPDSYLLKVWKNADIPKIIPIR